jgi:hypothetical protein
MLYFEVRKETVKNGGGTLTCDMGVLPWGDLMMLENAALPRPGKRGNHDALVRAGSIWVSNQELRQRTRGDSTHQKYDNLYDRFRAGEHIQRQEMADVRGMEQFIREQRDFSRLLIDMRAFTPEEQAERLAMQQARIERLLLVRDPSKVEARTLMSEAVRLRDATDRRNPLAMGFKSGAAIDRCQKRRQRAIDIWSREVWRTRRVSLLIVYYMDLYGELWDALSMRSKLTESAGQVRIFGENAYIENDNASLLAETRGRDGLEAAARRLLEYGEIFAAIQPRPFRKNAAHVGRELKEAALLCKQAERERLRTVLRKLRRGIRWVFAQDSLQMDVIRPLSLLMDELKPTLRRERGPDGTFLPGRSKIGREAAPYLFAEIEGKLLDLRTKVRLKCNDDDLATRIKERVEIYLGTAQECLANEDWQQAKYNLLQAARCL